MRDKPRRCPSINPWDADDRCRLAHDHEHFDGHEGAFRGRNVMWDFSPIEEAPTSEDFWEAVDA